MKTATECRSEGSFEKLLRSGKFAVTCELSPPDSADPQRVLDAAAMLSGSSHALNATDGSGAHCHMSSVAVCAILTRNGFSPIMQVSCRDRNRIAIQGDVLGAAAMGVHNILCLTGDDVSVGDQPEAKRVFDLDSIQLLRTIRVMRDTGKFLSGRVLTEPPKLFLGAASNPFVPPYEFRAVRLAKKIEAGAEFFQSQYCFDVPRLRQFMAQARDLGLHELAYYLVGVGPLRSEKAAEYLRTKVPGVHIPDAIVDRLRKTPEDRQQEEGRQICLEIIEEVKAIEGVSGIHIMAYKQEELVPSIVADAGLLS
ncbi:MAG: methylenetetrahydrofolate reductase [Woeseiaceae bacterium]